MNWSSGWPEPAKSTLHPETNPDGFTAALEASPAWPKPLDGLIVTGIDLSTKPDTLVILIGKLKEGFFDVKARYTGDEARAKIAEYDNVSPTHDPYTNPNAHVYHSCGCGSILDPQTKSFAELNSAASVVGWKVRWPNSGSCYIVYCPECGKDVE